jgi:hypothetical protein
MEGTSIDVRAFRDRGAAAAWLGVPLHVLDDIHDPEHRDSSLAVTMQLE